MELISKTLMGLGVVGSCCSTAIPMIANSETFNGRVKRSITEEPQFTFEELGTKVNHNGQEKQNSNNQVLSEFPLKKELESGLLSNIPKEEKSGEIRKNEWKDCGEPKEEIYKYCGYLELYRENVGYKLKIDYQGKNSEFRGYLLKNEGGENKYWNSRDSQGKNMTSSNFHKFESFTSSNANEGDKLTETSFTKDLKIENKK